MKLPTDAQARKAVPLFSGVLAYFPLALAEVARVSKAGNDQHNPGLPLHWAKGKSTDHADCAARHLTENGAVDTDGQRHTAKAAWRILALLEMQLEAEAAGMSYADYIAKLQAAAHPGPKGTRSGLGRLPCGCKAYATAEAPVVQPATGYECKCAACEAHRRLSEPFRPRYSDSEDLSPDARYNA